jgi:splicing factor 3A subunit 3
MILEEQRGLHEDIERLESAVADRIMEDPKAKRDQLSRDHEMADFLTRIQEQSQRLMDIYRDTSGTNSRELQAMSTGDTMAEFYKQVDEIKDFHKRYPNEPVENLERAYKRHQGEETFGLAKIDSMFSGEEGFGRYFDLTTLHEDYLNLPGVKGGRRITYIQYLDNFDSPTLKRHDKLTDAYFTYIKALASYLEAFMRNTRPLEDLKKLFKALDAEFEAAWEAGEVPGWGAEQSSAGPGLATEGEGVGTWCRDCQKEFKNSNVYEHHLTSKKHIRAAAARQESQGSANGTTNGATNGAASAAKGLKEKVVASQEFKVKRLASAMQTERSDTRVNVERRQGMTERERALEIQALYEESADAPGANDEDEESEGDDKIYNPLKLPLAWDGKPIPFWLYKLHGLGVEFKCEICGDFVYMGRRAFDKHFNEGRHIYGLKCLGITNTTMFREITGIQEAVKLWDKMQRDKKEEKAATENVVQMEDPEGNVMPEKVYYDLQKQGLL